MNDLSQRVQAFLGAYAGDAPVPESVVEIVGALESERRRLVESGTRERLLTKATVFMVREYGVPATMVDEDCADRWHERLGLLATFIDEICSPDSASENSK